MPTARLQIHLLGPFRLLQGGQTLAGFDQARLQRLLAYLVLHPAVPISRQQLAFAFWPDTTDQQALKNLRTLLTRLRHALPNADHFIAVTAQTIQWRPDEPLSVDTAEFAAALAHAAALEAGDRTATAGALANAVAAYGGDLLPDCYDDWVLPLREQLHQAYGNALERLVLVLEEQREYTNALPYARRLLHHDSLQEAAYRYLMRLHLALGDRAEALRLHRACETMLTREFGTGPERATRDLYERLREMAGIEPPAGNGSARERSTLPLVGRKTEWSRLAAAWRSAAAGRSQMVLLTGEAGIGKTRLAEELCSWVGRQDAKVAVAHCYPEGTGTAVAYAPVAEWLRNENLRPRLDALDDVWLVEITRILPALLAKHPHLTPPGPLAEAWQRTRLFEALARAMLGSDGASSAARAGGRPDLAANRIRSRGPLPAVSPAGTSFIAPKSCGPLLLFLDDLQWCDQETLDWLGYLLRFDPQAPLLIVAAVRKYEIDKVHPLMAFWLALTRSGLLDEILLTPLDAMETGLLAADVAGRAVDACEATQIYHDTEGNPLFVVETVRARMGGEQPGKQPDKEATEKRTELPYSAAPLSTPLALPAKVRAVIQWRLAQLSPAGQAVAQIAAVVGRRFNLDVIAQASGQDEAQLVESLDELWRRQLVRAQGADGYDFSHDGIRAVAYDDISPIRRRAIHLRVARALENFHRDELDAFSGQIAGHYERAGQMQPAVAFYRRAAAAAQGVFANTAAARLYQHVLDSELSAGLPASERCAVMLALAEVLRGTGGWAEAETISRDALVEAEALDDPRMVAHAQHALGDVLQLLGYYDAALACLAEAERGFKAVSDWRGVVNALRTVGEIHWRRGAQPQALATLERQLEIATEIDDPRGIAEALEKMGVVLWSQGDWDRAADNCLKAISIANPLEYKPILANAAITLGNIRSGEHRFGEAVHWYQRAGAIARELDDRQALSWATSSIASILAKRGEYLRASAGYERSLRIAREIGDRWTACLNVAGLAAVKEHLDRPDEAEWLYRKAIALGLLLGIPSYLAGMLVGLARFLLAHGRAAEGHSVYDEALAQISGVAGERVAGEDTRFDARVLGIHLRRVSSECTDTEAAADLHALLQIEDIPTRRAALYYELWRLAPEDAAARETAAAFYRSEYAETGAEESRRRYWELTGEILANAPALPDVSELIPDQPESLDLAPVLAELGASFE
jgi:DNA-binding SARP family transcriptional activator